MTSSSTEFVNYKINQRIARLDSLEWATPELCFEFHEKIFSSKSNRKCSKSLSSVLMSIYQNSCFGNFLQDFNKFNNQGKFINENKLGIDQSEYSKLDENEKNEWKDKNSFTADPTSILIELIKTEEVIDILKVKDKIKILRLKDYDVSMIF